MVLMLKSIEQLEKKGALSTLLFLRDNQAKEWMITELMDRIDCSQRALYSAIQLLHQLGLIQQIRKPEFNRRYIGLTDKGKAVAGKLKEVAEML